MTITSKLIITNFENVVWFNRNTLKMDLFCHFVQFIFSHFSWIMLGSCVSLYLRIEKRAAIKMEEKKKNENRVKPQFHSTSKWAHIIAPVDAMRS